MEKSKDIITILDQEIQEELNKEKQVVQLLNEFGKISLEKKYEPLLIEEKDNLLISELVNSKFKSLKEIIEVKQRYKESHFATFAFKALFLGKEHIKIENDFENRIKCFKSILESVKIKDKKMDITKLKELGVVKFLEIHSWPILGFQKKFPACVALIILNKTDSIEEFLELIITALEISYEYESKIDFKELNGISAERIIEDLKVIFNNGSTKIDNHFKLLIKNGHLVKENMTKEEVMVYINGLEESVEEEEEDEVPDNEEKDQKENLQEKKNNNIENNEKENKNISGNSTPKDSFFSKEEFNGELQIIQTKDALKAFLDFCCIGLRIDPQDYSYEDKAKFIIEKITDFMNKENYDKKIINELMAILTNIYKMIKKGNKLTHKVDLSQSIIQQIIEVTVKNDIAFNYIHFADKFNSINADEILKSIIKNQKKNYFDVKKLLKEQDDIYKQISNIELIMISSSNM